MSIKRFFKKVGGAISKAGRWIKNKAIPFAGRLIKPVVHGISMLPGKLGMIGKLGSALTGIAGGVVDQIPNDKVRNGIHSWIEREAKLGQTAIGKLKEGSERVRDAVNIVHDGYTNKIKPIISSNTS